MPREIKTTLMVDGEAAFKRSINEANTSIKNMGTQLTLAAAQFKKDGDAMKLMESRSKTLKSEIGQQENIVKALERAVEESTKAYGENSEKTERWEAELNRARTRLVNLESELTLNEQGLDRNGKAFDQGTTAAAKYGEELQNIGKNVSLETLSKGVEGITGTLENAIEKVIDLGKRVTEMMREASSWADQLMTDAMQNGLSVEDQQRMEWAAQRAEISMDTLMSARDRIIRKMVGGWTGEGGMDMWEFLGIDASLTRDPLDVLFDFGEALKGVTFADKNAVRANEWAMEVLGRGYKEMMPLFEMGREGFRAEMAAAPINSEETVQKLNSLSEEFELFDARLNQLKRTALSQLAPALEKIVGSLSDMLDKFNAWLETEEGKQAMQELSEAIESLFSGLSDVDFSKTIESVKNAINSIKDALEWISKHKGDVKTALEVIAGGFALLKVSDVVLRFLQLKGGLNDLIGGNGGNGNGTATDTTAPTNTPTAAPTVPTTGSGLVFLDGILAQIGATSFLWGQFDMLNRQAKEKEAQLESMDISEEEKQARMLLGLDADEEQVREFMDLVANLATRRLDASAEEQIRQAEATGNWNGTSGGHGFDGSGYSPPFGTSDDYYLAMLGDIRQRGLLHSLISNYGTADDAIAGWSPWNMMLRYWGEYTDERGHRTDMPLESTELQEMIDYLRELEGRREEALQEQTGTGEEMKDLMNDHGLKITDALAEMKMATANMKNAADVVTGMDLRKFNSLPAEIAAAARSGTASGASGIRVYLDGAAVGRLVAPYVDAEIGAAAQ